MLRADQGQLEEEEIEIVIVDLARLLLIPIQLTSEENRNDLSNV